MKRIQRSVRYDDGMIDVLENKTRLKKVPRIDRIKKTSENSEVRSIRINVKIYALRAHTYKTYEFIVIFFFCFMYIALCRYRRTEYTHRVNDSKENKNPLNYKTFL